MIELLSILFAFFLFGMSFSVGIATFNHIEKLLSNLRPTFRRVNASTV